MATLVKLAAFLATNDASCCMICALPLATTAIVRRLNHPKLLLSLPLPLALLPLQCGLQVCLTLYILLHQRL
jgi:hypothetical protein